MIEQIIIKFMADNRRLVVPSFGAFLKKESDAEVVFVEFLKKDDGVLVSLLENEYAIPKPEAEVIVEQYVLSAKQQLARTGEFIMTNLGVMRVDANNLYNFDYNPAAVANRGVNPPVVSPIVAAAPVEPIAAVSMPRSAPAQTPVALPTPPIHQSPKPTPSASVKVAQSDGRSVVQQQSTSQSASQSTSQSSRSTPQSQADLAKPQLSEPVKGLRYQKPIKSPYSAQNKKRADTIMIIAIIAALIAIGSMLYGVFADTGSGHKLREDVAIEVVDSTQQAVR